MKLSNFITPISELSVDQKYLDMTIKLYSFVFVYPKDIINDDHRYIKTEIFICKSNDGLNFTKIINLGYLKNNGLPFKIDIHNNSVNVYYIINFKSKMITFNKIYDI